MPANVLSLALVESYAAARFTSADAAKPLGKSLKVEVTRQPSSLFVDSVDARAATMN